MTENKYKIVSLITDTPELFEEKLNKAAKEGYRPIRQMIVLPTAIQNKTSIQPGFQQALLMIQLTVKN